jgi:hypothetical protein
MSNSLNKLLAASLCIIISACASTPLSQQEVARDFWTAMAIKDLAKAKTYAKPGSMEDISATSTDNTIDKIDLKPPIEQSGMSVVPTTVNAVENGEAKSTAFNTVLEQVDGEWKVNFDKTMASMMGFSMQDMVEGKDEAMKGAVEAVGKDLGGGQGEAVSAP